MGFKKVDMPLPQKAKYAKLFREWKIGECYCVGSSREDRNSMLSAVYSYNKGKHNSPIRLTSRRIDNQYYVWRIDDTKG